MSELAKKHVGSVAIILSTIVSINASYADTNDLLRHEQWALESTQVLLQTASSTGETTNDARGTCASAPLIDGDSYSCENYTALPVTDMDINVLQGWDILQSSEDEAPNDIVIGLVDTGIDYLHPDLASKIWLNPGEALYIDANANGIDDGCEDNVDLDENGYLDDCHGINTRVERLAADGASLNPAAGDPIDNATGHGTNMAGVIGAVGDNADENFHGGVIGVTGLQNNIRIATCAAAKVVYDAYITIPNLAGAYGTHDDILECFNYFIDLKSRGVNVVVINASGGASKVNNLNNIIIPKGVIREKYRLNTPQIQTAMDTFESLDISVVAASGNNSWDIDKNDDTAYFPAAFTNENIIAVGAINNQGERWQYSSYGRWSVDVFAPGAKILSTVPRFEITDNVNYQDYVVSDGSSQATALVTGMVALAKSHTATKHLTASELRRLIISSGKSLSGLENKSLSGKLARLADTDDSGFLNCNNRVFQRRHLPKKDSVHVLPGDWFRLEVVSYNCHAPGTNNITATVSPGDETFILKDDGIYPDNVAGDGIFSGEWQATSAEDLFQISWGTDTTTGISDIIELHTAIVVDNEAANSQRIGSWWHSIFRPGFYGGNYRYAGTSNNRTFLWKPNVSRAGFYEVYAHWPNYGGFTQHAEYTIQHGDPSNPQSDLIITDQSSNGGQWNLLGTFWFDAGQFDIALSNQNATANVIADAIKLRPLN